MRYPLFALLIACSLGANMAHAAKIDAKTTITFTGTVTDQTCGIGIGEGGPGVGAAVELPPVHVDQFSGKGIVVGKETFTLAIAGCKDKGVLEKGVEITFSTNNLTEEGYLINQANDKAASGIALRLSLDEDGVKELNPKKYSGILFLPDNADGKESSHTFGVQYISIDEKENIKAGKIKAIIEAQMTYL